MPHTRFDQLDETTQQRVRALLEADARAWWYHRDLRARGQVEEATRRENASIRSHLDTINLAVYGCIAHTGQSWTIVHRVRTERNGTTHVSSHLEGYGGRDSLIIQAAVLAGVPVLDYSVPGCDISAILQASLAAGAHLLTPEDLPPAAGSAVLADCRRAAHEPVFA